MHWHIRQKRCWGLHSPVLLRLKDELPRQRRFHRVEIQARELLLAKGFFRRLEDLVPVHVHRDPLRVSRRQVDLHGRQYDQVEVPLGLAGAHKTDAG